MARPPHRGEHRPGCRHRPWRRAAGRRRRASASASSAISAGKHVDDAAAEDDDDAVADALHLLELGGVEEHRLALAGELAQQAVDLLLGARRRCRASGRSRGWCGRRRRSSGRSSPSAGCRRTGAAPRACARVSICSRSMAPTTLAPLRRMLIGPQLRKAGAEGQRDVLAHRALHQQAPRRGRRGHRRCRRGWRRPDGRS